jgi:DNA invertase Pin-like site-specific DNA recombinase
MVRKRRPGCIRNAADRLVRNSRHLVAGVLFAIAEIELQHTRERQAAGIAAAKKKGVYKGREKGATKAKPRRAKELKGQGLSAPEIAQVMGISERTVRRYLSA